MSRDAPVVLVTGLIASGKSTVSRAIADDLGATRLEADRVRGTLLHALETEASGAEARWRRDFSPGFEGEIYADLIRRADAVLAQGDALVLDGCFPLRVQRAAVRALAARHERPFVLVHCTVPDAVRRARLAERDRAAGVEGWETIDRGLADHYEPPGDLPASERLEVTSDGPTAPVVTAVRAHLSRSTTSAPRDDSIPLPRVASFDCWGTLLSEEDWHWAHELRISALAHAAREADSPVSHEHAREAFETAWHRHQARWQAGEESGARDIATWGLEALQLDGTGPVHDRLVHRFEEASHTGQVVALEGASALLAALARAGIPSVLVCDTGLTPGRVVRGLLDRQGLLEHLRVQAFSDEVGAPKPDPRPFRAAIAPFSVPPEEVLHVGDLRRTDVAGAHALGMRTVRIRARHDDVSELPDADHVVDSHLELAAMLGLELGAS